MGREQRRKEARKNKNHVIHTKNIEENKFKVITLFKIILSVVIILLVLYYVLAVFVTKEIDVSGNKDSDVSDNNDTSNVTNKILGAATFKQSEATYYVYYYDFDEEDEEIANVISSLNDSKVYRVDTGSSLNGNYVTEGDSNKNVTDISNLKVKNPTIIKIDNDKVIEYHEGVQDIVDFINNR